MADAFDPYYKWLGIPQEEQPPHRYRLLGIKPFEADPDVIEAAADQRMLLLRTHQTGQHSRLSQQLLNEVAAAKVCLLNAETKAAYDAQLSETLGPPANMPAPPPPRTDAQSAPELPFRVADPSGADTAHRTRSAWHVPVAAAMVCLAAAVTYAYWAKIFDAQPPGSLPGDSTSTHVAVIEIDWPEAERDQGRLVINRSEVTLPPTGAVEYACEAGDYRIVARRPGYQPQFLNITVEPGQHHSVTFTWEPIETLLVIRWASDQRDGGTLSIDGQPKPFSPAPAWVFPMEPGPHTIVATLPGYAEYRETVSLGLGTRTAIELKWEAPASDPPSPENDAVLVCEWPEDQRANAVMKINGTTANVPATGQCVFQLPATETEVVITRPGYEPFRAFVGLMSGEQRVLQVALREQKRPVPSDDRFQEFARRIDEQFEVASATTPEEKLALAALLVQEASDRRAQPDEQYVLLCRAMVLATDGGDAQLTIGILEAIGERFDVDLLDTKLQAWQKLAEQAETPEQLQNVAVRGLALVEELHAADRPELARTTAAAALRAARLAADPPRTNALTQWVLVCDGELSKAAIDRAAGQAAASPASRSPVPDEVALGKAQLDARELFGEERRAARTPEAKAILAATMLRTVASATDGTAGVYVVLCMARDLAAEAGDIDRAWEAIERLDAAFRIDPLAMKAATVTDLVGAAHSADECHDLAIRVLALTEDTVARGDANTAKQLVERALRLARKAEQPLLMEFVVERRKQILQALVERPDIDTARAALSQNPLDPQANQIVGQYLAIVRGDWESGVPMLALGPHEPYCRQAIKDLAGAATPKGKAQIGDGWWDLAALKEGQTQRNLQARAVHWYRLAIPDLTDGQAVKRIASFEAVWEPPTREPFLARICSACSGAYTMYVNGEKLVAGSTSPVISETSLARGDVITVRASRPGSADGFCCVIQFETGVTFTTSPAWEGYQPKEGASDYLPESITTRIPVVPAAGNKPRPSTLVLEKCNITAPTIWPRGAGTSCFLTFTIP